VPQRNAELTVAYVVDRWQERSETFIREEITELRRQGVRVEVIALGPGDIEPDAAEPAIRLDLHTDHVTRIGAAAALLCRPRAAVRFATALVRMRPERPPWRRALPDVATRLRTADARWVHAHFGWEASGVAQALAALLGTGWSFTAHANDIYVRNEHLGRKLHQVSHLATVCQYNVEQLRSRYSKLPEIEVFVCGVSEPAADENVGPTEVDVLGVGRLVEKKGFDVLVEACAVLVKDRPHLRVEVIGEGPEREALHAQIVSHGLEANIRMPGDRPHSNVLERMRQSAIVCLPARIAGDGDRDSMPVVLKEAMARGVPVVGTSVAAIPEMVDDCVGRLVPPDDEGALAAALDELLADEHLRSRLGRAGRQRVRERFLLADEVAKLRATFDRWVS
jgi:glycosyltransferase involved in cell wall biosynthesis